MFRQLYDIKHRNRKGPGDAAMRRVVAEMSEFDMIWVSAYAASLPVAGATSFADQASRGHSTYTKQCAPCHQNDLNGTDMVPPLAGEVFLARWDGKTAKDLLERTRTTMPASNHGGLIPEDYLTLMAYILQANDIAPPQDLTVDNLASVTIHQKN